MKNIFLVALLLSSSLISFGQTLYVPSGTSGIGNSTNGNVGIGNLSPEAKFTISQAGNGWYDGLRINRDASNYLTLTEDVTDVRLKNWGSGGVLFFTSSVEALRILNNGNVGIGTATPQALLHVTGTSYLGTTGNEFYVSSGTTSFGTKAGIRNNGGDVVFNSKNGGTVYLNRDVAADVKIQSYNATTSSITDIATFLQSGNVGIGTTNPGSYKLAVEGKIGAREVNVIATNPWPDYVFEKNYTLPTLESIKTYIDQNKHLPEVPSATEVEKNGVNLGEMNALLLKKIEELTLHLIEQQEQIKTLRAEVSQLKK